MLKLRVRMSIDFVQNIVVTPDQQKDLRAIIERAVASALPGDMPVSTVKVTRINEAKEVNLDAALNE